MAKFADSFSGLDLDRKLTDQELIRALREMLAAELEAANLYSQLATSIRNEKIAALLNSIAEEELVHVGEFRAAIALLNDGADCSLSERGMEEAKLILASGSKAAKAADTKRILKLSK